MTISASHRNFPCKPDKVWSTTATWTISSLLVGNCTIKSTVLFTFWAHMTSHFEIADRYHSVTRGRMERSLLAYVNCVSQSRERFPRKSDCEHYTNNWSPSIERHQTFIEAYADSNESESHLWWCRTMLHMCIRHISWQTLHRSCWTTRNLALKYLSLASVVIVSRGHVVAVVCLHFGHTHYVCTAKAAANGGDSQLVVDSPTDEWRYTNRHLITLLVHFLFSLRHA